MNQYKTILDFESAVGFEDFCHRIECDDYELKYFQMFVNGKEIKNFINGHYSSSGVYKIEYERDPDIVKEDIKHCYIYFKYSDPKPKDHINIIYVTTYRNGFNTKSKFKLILS